MPNEIHGFLCIHKPAGPSSFAALRHFKKFPGIKKIGHCGTLDPLAEGLLVVAFGHATRCISYLNLEPKIYEFGIRFGIATNTLDSAGTVEATSDILPTQEQIASILSHFTGAIEQVPPKYSALKIDGERAYDLARKNVAFDMKKRTVFIQSLELTQYDKHEARFMVSCSTGTYVRSLARDIAEKLGTVGHASFIIRRATGPFLLADAVKANDPGPLRSIIPLKKALSHLPVLLVTDDQKNEIAHGRAYTLSDQCVHASIIVAIDTLGEVVALLSPDIGTPVLKPVRVFI